MVGAELTRITRLITATAGPHAAARPHDKFARIILAQLEGVRATFESLVSTTSREDLRSALTPGAVRVVVSRTTTWG